jgi:hypothetical protein
MAQPLATEEPSDDDDDYLHAQRSGPPMPAWERRLVVASLVVHVADVILDLLVVVFFLNEGCGSFGVGSVCVVLWACAASSLYMSCGSGREDSSSGLDYSPRSNRPRQFIQFLLNLSQVQIFGEAYRCLFHRHDGDFFHTLRLMQAILEAAPNALVQLYALAYLPSIGVLSTYGQGLLRTSVLTAFLSVGLSFSMFEQKVQAQTSAGYVACVALMRIFEIASRSFTLSLYAAIAHPSGFWWALLLDYIVMVCLTIRHKSVRSSYSFFLSVPLVLMSYEPVVWRREDHVVPKDRYYVVRLVEFVLMWIMITTRLQPGINEDTGRNEFLVNNAANWGNMSLASWFCTIGLFLTLPCIYRVARRHELSRDGMANDADFDQLEQGEHDFYSDSDGSHSRDYESEDDDDTHAKDGLLSGAATHKDFSQEEAE